MKKKRGRIPRMERRGARRRAHVHKLCKCHPAGYGPKTTECIKLNNNERKGLWILDAAPKGFSVESQKKVTFLVRIVLN